MISISSPRLFRVERQVSPVRAVNGDGIPYAAAEHIVPNGRARLGSFPYPCGWLPADLRRGQADGRATGQGSPRALRG